MAKPCRVEHPYWLKVISCITVVLFLAFTFFPTPLYANPAITDIQGNGTYSDNLDGNTLNINVSGNMTGSTTNADQLANETWNIHFENSTDSFVLQVFDSTGTQLMGTINIFDGLFAILNSSGIEIGAGAAINLFDAAFIASAVDRLNLNIDSLTDTQIFEMVSGGNGFVLNEGVINALGESSVALLGKAIENAGEIHAPLGTVMLGAGEVATVGIAGGNLISIAIEEPLKNIVLNKDGVQIQNQIHNTGLIEANGGEIIIRADALNEIFDNAVNLEGIIRANEAVIVDGVVEIIASDDIQIGGVIEATGGEIKIESKEGKVELTGELQANEGRIEIAAMDDIYTEAIIKATNGLVFFESEIGGFTNMGALEVFGGSIEINVEGIIENAGSIEADYMYEHGYTFRTTGYLGVTNAWFDNTDLAADISGDIGAGTYNDVNFNVTGDLTLLGNVTWNATGAFTMGSSYSLAGGGNDLTISAVSASSLGSISGVGTMVLSGGATFTSDPTATTWSTITDFRISNGTELNRFTGAGSGADPYMIYDVYGLQGMNGYLSSDFNLANSIDASSTSGWNSGEGWNPVGNSSTKFTGTFDGNNHTISGLTIDRFAYYQGLFGDASSATIQNVGLINVSITGRHYVGGLVGRNSSTDITNSYVTGDVTGTGDWVGGLVGLNYNSSAIINSYATATVTADERAGGLVGVNSSSGSILNSYATGDVITTGFGGESGGLVGLNSFTAGSITNSYSVGEVSGVADVGGFIGRHNSGGGTLTNNYWLKNAGHNPTLNDTGNDGDVGGISTEATLSNFYSSSHAVYTGASPWTFGDGNGGWVEFSDKLPHLDWEWSTSIETLLQLQNMQLDLDNDYTLANNIDASATSTWNDGSGWNPVGNSSTKFTGTFDGNNHTISGLTIDRTVEDYQGLFGYTDGATIQNVGLLGGSVTAGIGNSVGFLAGRVNSTTITNVYSTGTVSGNGAVGGLVGLKVSSSITNSYVTGAVSGNNAIGGLVGYNDSSITNSYATGAVNGNDYVGGLVGQNNNTSASITNSYSTGSVTGRDYVGGLAGYANASASITNSYSTGNVTGRSSVGGLVGTHRFLATISNSYSVGSVTGGSNVGGLIGHCDGGTLTNNFWNTQTSGQTTSAGQGVGAVEGKTTTQMMQESTYSTWSMDSEGAATWSIEDGESFAYHQWQYGNDAQAISGIAYQDSGSTEVVSGTDITIAVNGTAVDTVDTYDNGFYYLLQDGTDLSADDVVLAYINDDAVYNGNSVTKLGSAGAADFNIFGNNTLIVRDDSGNGITNANLSTAYLADSGDVFYSVTGSDLDTDGNETTDIDANLLIWTEGTYAPGGNVNVSGNWTNNGTFTSGNNTVTFDGDDLQTITGTNSFYNLTIANTYATPDDSNDVDAEAVTVTNILTVSDGQFQAATGSDFNDVVIGSDGILKNDVLADVSVSGDWSNSGTFTHNNGTVTFDGTSQQINDDNTFNDLTKIMGTELVFEAGSTQTIDGMFTANGITLKSSLDGTEWNIAFQPDGWDLTDITVQDSNNTNYADPTNPTGYIDQGGTVMNMMDGTPGGSNTSWFQPESGEGEDPCLTDPSGPGCSGNNDPCLTDPTGPGCGGSPEPPPDDENDDENDSEEETEEKSFNYDERENKGDDCSSSMGKAMSPECREKATTKITVYEGAVYVLCNDDGGNPQLCGIITAGTRIDVEWNKTPGKAEELSGKEKEYGKMLYKKMRRKK